MKLSIQGKRMELTEAIKTYAERKFEKLEKFHDGILEMNVTLSAVKFKTGNAHTAEVLVYLSGKTLKAMSTEEDLYFAIDQAADSIETQLKKHRDKSKRASSERRGKSWKFNPETGTVVNQEERNMVRVFLPNKPMSVEEALLQLEVLDKQFYVFKSLEHGKMCVVYKRKDGDYGYIVDEA